MVVETVEPHCLGCTSALPLISYVNGRGQVNFA